MNKTLRLLNEMKRSKRIETPKNNEFILPNHSGLKRHPEFQRAYGEIYSKDNTTPTVLNSAAKVQILVFTTNGVSHDMTPNFSESHIIVQKSAIYLVKASVTVANNNAFTHILNVDLFKNNGSTQFENVHFHRKLTGGSGDIGSATMSGLVQLNKDETIELWANTDAAADRSVIFDDITLSITQID